MHPRCAVRPPSRHRRLLLGLALGLTLRLTGVASAQEDLRVAAVDVAKIFKEYGRTRELDAKIDEATHTYENEVGARVENHHRLVEELARIDRSLANPALGAPERADGLKKRTLNLDATGKVERDLAEFKAEHERLLKEMIARARTQIVEEIMVVVNARVGSRGYDLVLNRSAHGAGPRDLILYVSGALDITDDVIATLNRTHGTRPPAVAP